LTTLVLNQNIILNFLLIIFKNEIFVDTVLSL